MNQRDDEGNPHGYWEQYYPDGNPCYKGKYINGIENGYWIYFNFLGNLVEKEFYL